MGKGTVSDWHKQQRKKELKKNKEVRLAARNEKTLQEKTTGSVRKELETLERQYSNKDNKTNIPHGVQTKIDRLKKELKLLEEKEAEDRRNRVSKKNFAKNTSSYKPLAKPEVSIYFDAVFNPFGEPPPGKPRLFHRRGGGTTLNLDEACVPGDHDVAVATPQSGSAESGDAASLTHQTTTRDATSATHHHQQHPDKSEIASRPREKKKQTRPKEKTNVAQPTKTPFDPSQVPELPPPSSAVKRSRGAVDIWASNVEEEYDEAAATHWYYRDTAGQQQGPFDTEQMKAWNSYFPPDTLVTTTQSINWRPMHTVKELRVVATSARSFRATESLSGVHDRIAALSGDVGSSVQDRIAALRGKIVAPERKSEYKRQQNQENTTTDSSEFSHLNYESTDRIAALHESQEEETVEDRIAKLKQQNAAESAEETSSIASRISSLKQTMTTNQAVAEDLSALPAPPPSPLDTNRHVPPPLPIPPPPPPANIGSAPPALPLPPPPSATSTTVPPAFPTPPSASTSNMIPPAFPLPPAPSLNNKGQPVPPSFPHTDAVALGTKGTHLLQPTTDSHDVLRPPAPKKAKIEDKSLVAFVPSHLLRGAKKR